MLDQDPDEMLLVPARELGASLTFHQYLLAALNNAPELAAALAAAMPPQEREQQLPEVGPVEDGSSLRLHLLRLAERLRPHVPGSSAGVGIPPVVRAVGDLKIRTPSRADALCDEPLADAFVWWDDIEQSDIDKYVIALNAASDERPLQRHLANNPLLLVQHLHGGHGRWVLSQKRLGSEYVTDFVIGAGSSSGVEWQFVELQSPLARLFVPSSGRHSEQLDEGIKQILEWRRWLDENRDYARRSRARQGLGLTDVSGRDPGLLLVGREAALNDNDRQRRRQLDQELNIRVHTYDWLVREPAARVRALQRHRQQIRD